MIEYVDIFSGVENRVNLPVSTTGTSVTIGAGPFTFLGQAYELDDDVDTDLGVESFNRIAFGYLVRVVATDEITVLWDSMAPGDWPFVFEVGGPYQLIQKLVALEIPADANDLSAENVDFKCFRLIEEV